MNLLPNIKEKEEKILRKLFPKPPKSEEQMIDEMVKKLKGKPL